MRENNRNISVILNELRLIKKTIEKDSYGYESAKSLPCQVAKISEKSKFNYKLN